MTSQKNYNSARFQPEQFSLSNLQPINYLKSFNKMLEYVNKTPATVQPQPQKQLRTVKLSKFPLHQYYQKMQGIFQANNKKNQDLQRNHNYKKQLQLQKNQQKFLDRHYKFVKDALQKIILDNQSQRKSLLKAKDLYKSSALIDKAQTQEERILKLVKLRSQPKLCSFKTVRYTQKTGNGARIKSMKDTSVLRKKTLQNPNFTQTQPSLFNKLSNRQSGTIDSDHKGKDWPNPIFRKLIPPKKAQIFIRREFQQVNSLLSSRRTLKANKLVQCTQQALTQRTHNRLPEHPSRQQTHENTHNKKHSKQSALKHPSKRSQPQNQQDEENYQASNSNFQQFNQFRRQVVTLPRGKEHAGENQAIEGQQQIFERQVQSLIHQQTTLQRQYAARIDQKIRCANLKLNQRIQAVRKFDFSTPIGQIKNRKQSSK